MGWKEFPDIRQNEKRVEFIRAVRTSGWLKGEPTPFEGTDEETEAHWKKNCSSVPAHCDIIGTRI